MKGWDEEDVHLGKQTLQRAEIVCFQRLNSRELAKGGRYMGLLGTCRTVRRSQVEPVSRLTV